MVKKTRRGMTLIFIFTIIVCLQSLPIFILKNIGMKNINGKYISLYYDSGDENGGKMVFEKLENNVEKIRNKLNYISDKKTEVYVYKKQSSLHIRKFGIITLLISPDWYIGDNKRTKALIVSPNADVKGNNTESIINVATHELVHTINYRINSKLSYFIDNGVATYLAEQKPYKNFTQDSPIPSIEFFDIKNEIKFGNEGGYQYSYVFIEFLDKEYGWDSVTELIRGNKSYVEIFGKDKQDIYNEWVTYVKTYY